MINNLLTNDKNLKHHGLIQAFSRTNRDLATGLSKEALTNAFDEMIGVLVLNNEKIYNRKTIKFFEEKKKYIKAH